MVGTIRQLGGQRCLVDRALLLLSLTDPETIRPFGFPPGLLKASLGFGSPGLFQSADLGFGAQFLALRLGEFGTAENPQFAGRGFQVAIAEVQHGRVFLCNVPVALQKTLSTTRR
ncbi:MAG: hypothetical protein OWQ56_01560 [Acidithiobacillus caldus]|nr:hypothetical protein [Acidithiobacillus caldus]